ncbi:MAG: transposase [Anaerolineae bacterium]|nr:transposase [Anaerolineae bacterium]
MNTADHHRRSIRLRGWDYTEAGAYFVTLVTHERATLFGDVVDGQVVLTEYGRIAAEEWVRTAEVRANVEMDEFVVMPNHVHGIVWIARRADGARQRLEDGARRRLEDGARQRLEDGARRRLAPTRGGREITVAAGSLGAIVGGYKSAVARRINDLRGMTGAPVWQRNYYERVVRSEPELAAIRRYIQQNPANWAGDSENRA